MAARFPDSLRSDFRRYYGVGFGEAVRGRVPLADVCAMSSELLHIAGSATAREVNGGEAPWERIDYLAAHLWQTQTGKPHPGLPKNKKHSMRDPKRQAAINAAKDRAAERRRLIEAGVIT